MQVWKFPLRPADVNEIEMPKGAEVLTIDTQAGYPMMWAKVDPDAEKETRHFRVAGTGHELGVGVGEYLGTFQVRGRARALIFHVFEMYGL